MNILFIGDIVGKGGRKAVVSLLPDLQEEYDIDVCIANCENAAGGAGITKRCINELTEAGVQVLTTGDHVWDQRDFVSEIEDLPNVLRPANCHAGQPGRGHGIFPTPGGGKIAVISLLGRTFMKALSNCPFQEADNLLQRIGDDAATIVVDMHAEATSEKIAMGRYLDGRVSAVLGTHTHVPTADQQIFPKGTAFQCDVGMVGSRESVLGRDIEPVLTRFATGMPARFTVAKHDIRLHATVVKIRDNGRAYAIERVVRDVM